MSCPGPPPATATIRYAPALPSLYFIFTSTPSPPLLTHYLFIYHPFPTAYWWTRFRVPSTAYPWTRLPPYSFRCRLIHLLRPLIYDLDVPSTAGLLYCLTPRIATSSKHHFSTICFSTICFYPPLSFFPPTLSSNKYSLCNYWTSTPVAHLYGFTLALCGLSFLTDTYPSC
jgi:hypothetical protein